MTHVPGSVSGPLFRNWWCSFTSPHYDRIYISHSVWKIVCEKDGGWQRCVYVYERWCVTKLCVKDGVWQNCVWKDGVWKMVVDKEEAKLCVKDGVWQSCVKRWCVKDDGWQRGGGGGGGGGEGGAGIQNQKQEPHTKMWGKNLMLEQLMDFISGFGWSLLCWLSHVKTC